MRLCDKVTYMEDKYGQYWFKDPKETYAKDKVWLSIIEDCRFFNMDERTVEVVVRKGKKSKYYKSISAAARAFKLSGNVRQTQLENALKRRGFLVEFVSMKQKSGV